MRDVRRVVNRDDHEFGIYPVEKALNQLRQKAPKLQPFESGFGGADAMASPFDCIGIAETTCAGAADSLIFTRFNRSALATTIKVEPDIDRAATSGLNSHPVQV